MKYRIRITKVKIMGFVGSVLLGFFLTIYGLAVSEMFYVVTGILMFIVMIYLILDFTSYISVDDNYVIEHFAFFKFKYKIEEIKEVVMKNNGLFMVIYTPTKKNMKRTTELPLDVSKKNELKSDINKRVNNYRKERNRVKNNANNKNKIS